MIPPIKNGTGGVFGLFPSVIPESSIVSQITPTPSYPPSILSTQYIEPPTAEALEAVTEPPSEPELAFGMRDAVDEDDRNTHNPTQLQKEQLCDVIPVVHPHLEQRYEPPPSKLPVTRKRAERLNSFLISMFKSPGKTQTRVNSGPLLNQPGMYDYLKSSNNFNQYLSGDAGLPLSLAEMISELRKRPDQDLIDRADGVCSSEFQHLHARVTQILDIGQHCM